MTAATAAAAAAAQIARMQLEEEAMTPYSPSDLDENWEFKIIRSARGKFRDPAFLAQTLAEESAAGWTLLEKFDDFRVRLKRRASARREDAGRKLDPYRISVGPGPGLVVAIIVGLSVALGVALIGAVFLVRYAIGAQ
jgi:hypothetical protein